MRFAHEGGSLHAVRGLNFDLFAGQTLAVVGESGSGKSSAALAILGLLPASARVAGSITLHGEELLGSTDQAMSSIRGRSVAMVFQDPLSAMTPVYTVGEQIVESILAHDDCSLEAARERAVQLLKLVGIAQPQQRINAYPHEFSGGMRQRALIAMAIANNPDVIIADEPTTALDVTIQAQVLEVLQQACRVSNAALLLITHDLGVVARMADQSIVMYAGRAVEQADTRSLFKRPCMPYTVGLLKSLTPVSSNSLFKTKRLPTIQGYPPNLHALSPGCAFAPRCSMATAVCLSTDPPLQPTDDPQHLTACLRYADISDDLFTSESLVNTNDGATVNSSPELLLELSQLKQYHRLYEGSLFRRQVGTVRAVDGIDLQLHEGETLALVGESGCGKSTTALSILDLQQPTSGSITLFGQNINTLKSQQQRLAVRRQLQVVFQDPLSSLDPRMTVHELIAEPLGVFDFPESAMRERVLNLLELVGLQASLANQFPQQLSGGQCQRVCIARALALEPKLLILDEPVSALDVSIRAGIINLLQDLKQNLSLSYLFIAHDLALVRHFADRVAIMYLGQIVESGEVTTVFDDPQHPYTESLLSLVPIPDPDIERARQRSIPQGELPDPAEPPTGCRFHTRCPKKRKLSDRDQEICATDMPTLMNVGRGDSTGSANSGDVHYAACHFSGRSGR